MYKLVPHCTGHKMQLLCSITRKYLLTSKVYFFVLWILGVCISRSNLKTLAKGWKTMSNELFSNKSFKCAFHLITIVFYYYDYVMSNEEMSSSNIYVTLAISQIEQLKICLRQIALVFFLWYWWPRFQPHNWPKENVSWCKYPREFSKFSLSTNYIIG